MQHMVVSTWQGLSLLLVEVRIAARYVWRLMKGSELTRREWKQVSPSSLLPTRLTLVMLQLTTTVADIFRMVPFSMFIIIPMAEFLLPFYIKFFPRMMPSTFKDYHDPSKEVRYPHF